MMKVLFIHSSLPEYRIDFWHSAIEVIMFGCKERNRLLVRRY